MIKNQLPSDHDLTVMDKLVLTFENSNYNDLVFKSWASWALAFFSY